MLNKNQTQNTDVSVQIAFVLLKNHSSPQVNEKPGKEAN